MQQVCTAKAQAQDAAYMNENNAAYSPLCKTCGRATSLWDEHGRLTKYCVECEFVYQKDSKKPTPAAAHASADPPPSHWAMLSDKERLELLEERCKEQHHSMLKCLEWAVTKGFSRD